GPIAAPSTAPGARFPHVWLDAAQSRGVHDALGSTGFTLLTGNEGEHDWQEATTTLHAPVRVCSIDRLGETDEARHALDAICSVGPRGALLVRPDGHVAWRRATLPEHPTQSLKEALRACHVR
ncbi:MAG: 2,4-dichlorophenol 6-monooxygenase, partial [Myxococcota bacterium]